MRNLITDVSGVLVGNDWLTAPVDKPPPYWSLGRDAALAATQDFALGTVGAGYGATTVTSKAGGLGSASIRMGHGFTVGALAAVNAVGAALIGDGWHFWAYEATALPCKNAVRDWKTRLGGDRR